MPSANPPGQTIRREASAGPLTETIDRHVAAALAELRLAGAVTGARSRKISVRVDPGAMRAAAARLGMTSPSDVVNASLAAAPDRFKAWWAEAHATLPDDFEIAVRCLAAAQLYPEHATRPPALSRCRTTRIAKPGRSPGGTTTPCHSTRGHCPRICR